MSCEVCIYLLFKVWQAHKNLFLCNEILNHTKLKVALDTYNQYIHVIRTVLLDSKSLLFHNEKAICIVSTRLKPLRSYFHFLLYPLLIFKYTRIHIYLCIDLYIVHETISAIFNYALEVNLFLAENTI